MIEHNDINCPKYWWRNLFYIQNMYPLDNMCMTWSWFLAADFQCFCLTSLLLVVYTKWVRRKSFGNILELFITINVWILSRYRKVAISIFVFLFTAASIYTGYLGYALKYSLTWVWVRIKYFRTNKQIIMLIVYIRAISIIYTRSYICVIHICKSTNERSCREL